MALKSCICSAYPRFRRDGNGRLWFVQCSGCDRTTIHCRTQLEAEQIWNDNRGFE